MRVIKPDVEEPIAILFADLYLLPLNRK